jgi:hypothetical protein
MITIKTVVRPADQSGVAVSERRTAGVSPGRHEHHKDLPT